MGNQYPQRRVALSQITQLVTASDRLGSIHERYMLGYKHYYTHWIPRTMAFHQAFVVQT